MKKYTPEQIELLRQSPYIMNVTENAVIYGDIFKQEFYLLAQKGFEAKEIYRILGLDPDIIGNEAILRLESRMKEYQPTRNESGEPISYAHTMMALQKEVQQLRFENEFLKKKRIIDLAMLPNKNKNDVTLN